MFRHSVLVWVGAYASGFDGSVLGFRYNLQPWFGFHLCKKHLSQCDVAMYIYIYNSESQQKLG